MKGYVNNSCIIGIFATSEIWSWRREKAIVNHLGNRCVDEKRNASFEWNLIELSGRTAEGIRQERRIDSFTSRTQEHRAITARSSRAVERKDLNSEDVVLSSRLEYPWFRNYAQITRRTIGETNPVTATATSLEIAIVTVAIAISTTRAAGVAVSEIKESQSLRPAKAKIQQKGNQELR